VFDPYTGYLNFFKSKAPTATACGHVDMAACRSIETTDPELKRCVLILPRTCIHCDALAISRSQQ
jgi:hypothetical protein